MQNKKNASFGIEDSILEKLRRPSLNSRSERPMRPLAPPVERRLLLEDLSRMELLIDTAEDNPDKGLAVYHAPGSRLPHIMKELGRLREETFRTVGEGSGLEADIDRFDSHYEQFVAWDKKQHEITGGYRIGRVDELLQTLGPDGVYTSTLFNLENLFAGDFKEGTLEAGRSFVRPEFQRGLTLLVIWMGLAKFVVKNPRYKILMGPVSISNEFHENSKSLMVNYLMKRFPHEKSDLVTSKNPPVFHSELSPEELTALVDASLDLRSLQEFVRAAEGNPRAQIPQLIKLYLELGVKFLAFNKDDEFNTIDGLIWLDLPNVPPDLLTRYMGEEGSKSYLARHRRA
ncbi:MAG: GNAT family N-acetyltransferase [Calothrix sp. SM1_5_4]|nr:GNAT family N-acetyltransferase [Calothrix sp. SM1_5_4]